MISFTVRGIPVPQGSMSAFMPKNGTRPLMHSVNGNKLKKWRTEVGKSAALAVRGTPAGKKVGLRVNVVFVLPQAKSNKNVEAVNKPDIDKLVRAALDGMTKIVYEDDCQVVELHASKEYGSDPRMEMIVEEMSVPQEMLRLAPPRDEDVPF
jgi:Holliday junction resolvase RusA-like endonuclease